MIENLKKLDNDPLIIVSENNDTRIIYMLSKSKKYYVIENDNIIKQKLITEEEFNEAILLIESLGLDLPISYDKIILTGNSIYIDYNGVTNELKGLIYDAENPSIYTHILDFIKNC